LDVDHQLGRAHLSGPADLVVGACSLEKRKQRLERSDRNWALKHGFLHACNHRPKVSSESGGTQAVPNRGLAAVVLILCLAFVLSSAFAILHSKLFRLYHPSLLEIGRQLYRSLWQLQPPIRAPTPESGL
jgi:hypothetical protein